MAETPSPLAVVAKGIHKTYSQGAIATPVLSGVDLSIKKGEFVAILGPSGSGKSTLLHILGLMDEPTQGEVLLLGAPTRSLDAQARSRMRNQHVGFVFQFDSLLPEFTILENVSMPGRIAGSHLPKVEARARELLGHFGISHLENRFPQETSGGERQRASIARALINRPAVVLADEPTGSLDRRNGELVFSNLKEVAQDLDVAVVLVTHNEYASQFASRIFHLADGRLTETSKTLGDK